MDGWFEFAIERYNYWIVIVLMMTGLYTVFARGNLVKKVVGLNLFQTSVFIFYITIGKVDGGTAPIYIGEDLKKMQEGAHGDGHGEDHGGGHGDEAHGDASHGDGHGSDATLHDAPATNAPVDHAGEGASLHDKIDNTLAGNELKGALEALAAAPPETGDAPSLHATPEGADKIANNAFLDLDNDLASAEPAAPSFEVEELHAGAANAISDAAAHAEIIYTNPLPHVLILTAIVVGVATTAVGLALAVRIREAYGTIEEDELEAIDNVAEFGARGARGARADAAGGAA